jgi:hypothetical protein
MKHLIATLATLGLAIAAPTAAHASGITPGGTCSTAGTIGYHHDDRYECRQTKPGCLQWKYAGPVKGVWTRGPAQCPACTPTPTPSATQAAISATIPTPSPTHVQSSHASVAGAPAPSQSTAPSAVTTLPVTGPSPWPWVTGALCLLAGGALVRASRRRAH